MNAVKQPVEFTDGQLIDWSPGLAVRMLAFGVTVGGVLVPRRRVLATIRDVALAWWHWTTALPGDRFHDFLRDNIVEIDTGLGRHRRVKIASREELVRHGDTALDAQTPMLSSVGWERLHRLAT